MNLDKVTGPEYIDFRGSNANNGYNTNASSDNSYSQTKNSFYFYFGTEPGNTAVDLLNKKYFNECEVVEKNGATEKHPLEPISPYAITKRAVEMYLYAYQQLYGLSFTVLRYGNVYGPRQDPLGEAGVIAIFCGKLLAGELPTIYGDGKQLRDYIYVGDVARANLMALESGRSESFNVGTEVGVSVNHLFSELKKQLGFKGEAVYADTRVGELERSVLNCDRIRKELGWQAKTDIKKGLELTLQWAKS